MADGKIYFARTNGNLYSVDFANAAPVPGTEVLVSPASAGYDWASRAMFVYHQFRGHRGANRARQAGGLATRAPSASAGAPPAMPRPSPTGSTGTVERPDR